MTEIDKVLELGAEEKEAEYFNMGKTWWSSISTICTRYSEWLWELEPGKKWQRQKSQWTSHNTIVAPKLSCWCTDFHESSINQQENNFSSTKKYRSYTSNTLVKHDRHRLPTKTTKIDDEPVYTKQLHIITNKLPQSMSARAFCIPFLLEKGGFSSFNKWKSNPMPVARHIPSRKSCHVYT